jgi:hypothetical protein
MSLEIIGNLYKIMPEIKGVSSKGEWVKQDFIIETEDKFPKKVSITAWSEKVEDLKKLRPGDRLKVSFNLESREYNEKWFTDVKAWKIEKAGEGSSAGRDAGPGQEFERTPPPETQIDDDLPF